MPLGPTATAAAAWSWVEKMLQLAQRTSAPSSTSVSMSTAVWMVMCSEPEMRAPGERLRRAELLAQGAQAGHLVLGEVDLLAAERGEREIGDAEVAVTQQGRVTTWIFLRERRTQWLEGRHQLAHTLHPGRAIRGVPRFGSAHVKREESSANSVGQDDCRGVVQVVARTLLVEHPHRLAGAVLHDAPGSAPGPAVDTVFRLDATGRTASLGYTVR